VRYGSGLDEDFEALAVLHVLVAGRDTVDVGGGVETLPGWMLPSRM